MELGGLEAQSPHEADQPERADSAEGARPPCRRRLGGGRRQSLEAASGGELGGRNADGHVQQDQLVGGGGPMHLLLWSCGLRGNRADRPSQLGRPSLVARCARSRSSWWAQAPVGSLGLWGRRGQAGGLRGRGGLRGGGVCAVWGSRGGFWVSAGTLAFGGVVGGVWLWCSWSSWVGCRWAGSGDVGTWAGL